MSVEEALRVIRSHIEIPHAKVGLILGSGLSQLSDLVDGVAINYSDLPGFPHAGVSGHGSKLVIGKLEGVNVALLGGREHYYENGRADAMRVPLEVLASLGVETLFATNAAGSMLPDNPPGNLMLIRDHINFSGRSPLIGEQTDKRFVNMSAAYDPSIRSELKDLAAQIDVPLLEGVYCWYSGPNFETPAEIKMLKILGGDAVGMSTVPEIILGRFLGMKCCAVSVITNMAAGMDDGEISHEQTKASAPIGGEKLSKLIKLFLKSQA